MKRILVILIAATLCIGTGLCSLSLAQGMNEKMQKKMMTGDMAAKKGMMDKCPMHGMMMKGMMEKSMLATADGGVVVLAGNRLIKYDKDLNMVKEVEIKMDMEAMQKNMAEMMKNCPMMKGAASCASMMQEKSEQKK